MWKKSLLESHLDAEKGSHHVPRRSEPRCFRIYVGKVKEKSLPTARFGHAPMQVSRQYVRRQSTQRPVMSTKKGKRSCTSLPSRIRSVRQDTQLDVLFYHLPLEAFWNGQTNSSVRLKAFRITIPSFEKKKREEHPPVFPFADRRIRTTAGCIIITFWTPRTYSSIKKTDFTCKSEKGLIDLEFRPLPSPIHGLLPHRFGIHKSLNRYETSWAKRSLRGCQKKEKKPRNMNQFHSSGYY